MIYIIRVRVTRKTLETLMARNDKVFTFSVDKMQFDLPHAMCVQTRAMAEQQNNVLK